jgi:dTDP-4-amino-4,6-dideoxygalactose transaminase
VSRIPLADLAAAHAERAVELEAAALAVLRSGRYILGPEVAAFEGELADFVGVAGAVGVASGTDALVLALQALDLPPGSRVVTTPFTFFSTASCIVRLGYEPVFVDIDPSSFCLDTAAAARACEDEDVRAVIGVDLYGDVLDYAELRRRIDRDDVYLIEDAAQSFGAELRHRRAGALADLGVFSFFPAKNLGAAGDGGAVVGDDEELLERVRILRVHGANPKYHHRLIGINSRLDPLQAAMLRVKLAHIDEDLRRRRDHAAAYNAALAEYLRVPSPAAGHYHAYNYYVVATDERDALRAALNEAGIGSAVYYPKPLHLQPCFAKLGCSPGDLPIAEAACDRVLALPMYPQLSGADRARVIEAVVGFFNA